MTHEMLRTKISRVLDWLFLDRDIILRSNGKVYYFPVTRRLQVSLAIVGLMGLGWIAYTNASLLIHKQLLSEQSHEMERRALAYTDLLAEVNGYQDHFAAIAASLEGHQSYLASLLGLDKPTPGESVGGGKRFEQARGESMADAATWDDLREKLERFEIGLIEITERNAALRSEVTTMTGILRGARAESGQVADARDVLGRDLANLEADLVAVQKTRVDLELIVTALRDRLRRSYRARGLLAARNSELKLKAERLARRSTAASDYDTTLEKSLAAMADSYENQLAEMRAAYRVRRKETEKSHDASRAAAEATLEITLRRGARLERERNVLRIRVDNLAGRVASASKSQQAVLQRLTERALTGIESIVTTIAMTGTGIDTVLASFEDETGIDSSRGGPFLPIMLAMEGDPLSRLEASINWLDVQMNRWDALQQVVRGIPLAMPLDQYRISSSFGPRLDPINGKKARHKGMDLSAPKRTPVMSTAPGTVVFAGSRGDFGRVVEIDHGNGIRTLYGHLHKVLVKVGQEVGYREKIALLGNSGRSTGPHVHYEVLFKGRPRDPMKFLKAGRHVFQS